jgi:hypothetical protein
MPLAGFEATVPATERPQIHKLTVRPLGSALLNGMQTWTIAVNENGYTIKGAWELAAYLVNEIAHDIEPCNKPWMKSDVPVQSESVTLRLTVCQIVGLGVEPFLGVHDQTLSKLLTLVLYCLWAPCLTGERFWPLSGVTVFVGNTLLLITCICMV